MFDQTGIWQPILTGDLRERVIGATDVVANELNEVVTADPASPGALGGGDAGIALFFHYLDRVRPDNPYPGVAKKLLERAVDTISDHGLWFNLYAGITGIAWACQHVFRFPAEDDSLEAVDDGLVRLLDIESWPGLYELISGLAGMGIYSLERWPRGRSREILERVSDHLLALAVSTDQGLTWHTPQHLLSSRQKSQYVNGYYNCGVSHGMPAALGILAACVRLDINREPALRAVKDGVRWLLAQQAGFTDKPRFPTTVTRTGETFPSRIAWCYGDLGVAGLLARVALLLQDRDLADRAVAIGLHAASITEKHDGIVDAPLCHGAAGAGHIFNRLYQTSGEEVFRVTARRWFERLLAMRSPGEGIGGFTAYQEDTYRANPGFLEGSAGIGLAMLAAVSDVEPAWDRVLVMSFAE